MAGHSSSVIGNTMVVFGGSLGARQMYKYITCFKFCINQYLAVLIKSVTLSEFSMDMKSHRPTQYKINYY